MFQLHSAVPEVNESSSERDAMNLIVRMTLAAALAALAPISFAQDKSAMRPAAEGKAVAGMTRVKATVESIDQVTRTVTLRDSNGELSAFVAGDEVRNLAQVSVGDVVTLDYAAALAMRLAKSDSKVRERSVSEKMDRAAVGQMPAGTVVREIKVVASVEAIDAKKQMVTLRGPQQTVSMRVQDPAMLRGVKTGDMVEALYVEAMAIKVEKGVKK
jgi:Cu/Ag efflux protein CusF